MKKEEKKQVTNETIHMEAKKEEYSQDRPAFIHPLKLPEGNPGLIPF